MGTAGLLMPEKVMELHKLNMPSGDDLWNLKFMAQFSSTAQICFAGGLYCVVRANDGAAIKMVSKYMKWVFTLMIGCNLYATFGGLADSVWGSTGMAAIGLHSWTVLATLFVSALCASKEPKATTHKAPENTSFAKFYNVTKVPLMYTAARSVWILCAMYGVLLIACPKCLFEAYDIPMAKSEVGSGLFRLFSLGWGIALVGNASVYAAVIRSHSARTLYRCVRWAAFANFGLALFSAVTSTVWETKGGAEQAAQNEKAQAVLYIACFMLCVRAIDGKAKAGW